LNEYNSIYDPSGFFNYKSIPLKLKEKSAHLNYYQFFIDLSLSGILKIRYQILAKSQQSQQIWDIPTIYLIIFINS